MNRIKLQNLGVLRAYQAYDFNLTRYAFRESVREYDNLYWAHYCAWSISAWNLA